MGKLIRLELFNFKSYKGHHVLLFGDSYFTSIIGPNGSGKSNSMDAISFVLGIKSSHLRSTHLKDLVYRGRVLKTSKINDDGSADTPSANGDADGKSNGDKPSRHDPKTAWVMAVYEDDAGDEQKWKRSITSQGSSEYRINDRVVNAQQYNTALEVENILIKARNFLVFQGDVEAIAAQSPQDLTRLIEQISGSLEFKADYERLEAAAEKAAEDQSFQLHRRRGINSEIKQYQEQKREVENFQQKTEERDRAIVDRMLWELFHLQSSMDESNDKIKDHEENLQEFRRNVASFEKKLEAAHKELAAATRDVSKHDKHIRAKERKIEELENSLVPINQKVEQSTREASALRQRLDTTRRERDDQVKVLEDDRKKLKTVEKAQELKEREFQERSRKQGTELSDEDRKEYNALRSQVFAKTSANQNKIDNLVRQQKTDEVMVNSLKSKVDGFNANVEKLDGELETIQERTKFTKDTISTLSEQIDAKKKEFRQLDSTRVRTNNKRTELEEHLQKVARQLNEADDGRRQNDRETRMKETVSTLKRIYPGVKGRIGDLCKPKQKKFDEAVIIALGKDFESVVVDTEKTGMQCVQHLKDNQIPPMTFIPLDNIKVNAVNTAVKGISGARLTIDTIDFDSSYERAMAYACGSSVVCDDLRVASHICYEKKIPVKAVALDGTVIHKGGLMTGGRGPEHKGGKRRFEEHDVDALRRTAAKYTEEIQNLPATDRRAEDTLRTELRVLEPQLAAAKYELAQFEKNHASKSRERDHQAQQLHDWEPQYAAKNAELRSTTETLENFRAAISQVEDRVFGDFCKRLGLSNIQAYDAEHQGLQRQLEEERNRFEVQKERLKSTLAWNESRLKDFEGRVASMERKLKQFEKDLQTYEQQKSEIEDRMGEVSDELDALRENLQVARAEQQERSQKVAEAKAEVKSRSKEIEARQKDINALETSVQKDGAAKFALLRKCKMDGIDIPLVDGSLDNLPREDNLLRQDPDAMDLDDEDDGMLDAALDDHGIMIDFDGLSNELKNSNDESMSETLKERIHTLAAELEKINPNMKAMERLEGVETRLKNTEREFEDSRVALKEARDAFNVIKTKRYEVFNKAFTHISEQIKTVYKDLTRSDAYPLGGQAYLDKEEDNDTPYLAGIKYHAMPPLKRFRDMDLLSGGEKTMAALALLFAIHSYQPSPFFVLDEVDAALDNANVDKIKKYIREHAGPGMQFVVISLKAGLFQDSESLVGVYRDQEINSSRTLTLDLRKYV
ncbi:Structural maintenance of chromosomes protein 1 like [Verticillium longisporum]|uniref:Structural maintenance of chromosomes protein n=5 Tax=Verticillium longisporum TaxID=100787 RepID=A0A8I3AW06_VERLO|nr:Structural maintenance of chromosomes protein 1 like [Verticillium longisporum]